MAEMREVRSKEHEGRKRGPVSLKNLDHVEIHPKIGGGYRVMHHRDQIMGNYVPPEAKHFDTPDGVVKHIAKMLGLDHAEPGGEERGEHDEPEHVDRPHGDKEEDEGED